MSPARTNNQPASLETVLSPSILVDFPTPEGEFTGRYTFNLTYYSVGPNGNNGSGNNNGQLEIYPRICRAIQP